VPVVSGADGTDDPAGGDAAAAVVLTGVGVVTGVVGVGVVTGVVVVVGDGVVVGVVLAGTSDSGGWPGTDDSGDSPGEDDSGGCPEDDDSGGCPGDDVGETLGSEIVGASEEDVGDASSRAGSVTVLPPGRMTEVGPGGGVAFGSRASTWTLRRFHCCRRFCCAWPSSTVATVVVTAASVA
jgi:hypothetical protein